MTNKNFHKYNFHNDQVISYKLATILQNVGVIHTVYIIDKHPA